MSEPAPPHAAALLIAINGLTQRVERLEDLITVLVDILTDHTATQAQLTAAVLELVNRTPPSSWGGGPVH